MLCESLQESNLTFDPCFKVKWGHDSMDTLNRTYFLNLVTILKFLLK